MKKIFSVLLCLVLFNLCVPAGALAADFDPAYTEQLVLPKKLEKKTPLDVVNVFPSRIDFVKYNTFPVAFTRDFNSKYASVGEELDFVLPEDLKTTKGTVVLPASTVIVTEISNIEAPKAFNKSGKIYLNFKHIQLPDGRTIPIVAKVFSKNDYLSRGKLNAWGKGLGSTLGGLAVGTAAGCGIGAAAGAVVVGGFAIGMPVGFVLGATVGLITPGLSYRAKAGDKINIQLTDNLIIDR